LSRVTILLFSSFILSFFRSFLIALFLLLSVDQANGLQPHFVVTIPVQWYHLDRFAVVSWYTIANWLYLARYMWFAENYGAVAEANLSLVVRTEEIVVDLDRIALGIGSVKMVTE